MIINLLQENMSLEIISKISGLTIAEIKKIQEKNK